jgi:predicted MPP superfamily phosphohydrolase
VSDEIRILHLSDMHFTRRERAEWSEVWGSFQADLKTECADDKVPDFVVFTGDFAYSADETSVYCDAMDKLVQTCVNIGVPESHIVICPGNHDISQKWVSGHRSTLDGFREAALSRTKTAALFASPEFKEYATGACKAFYDALALANQSCVQIRNERVEVHLFAEKRLAVLSLNTALLSLAGLERAIKDSGFLAVSELDVLHALSKVPEDYRIICVGHHPIDWLSESCRGTLEPLLTSRAVAYLHGHMHDAQPRALKGLRGSCLFSQAGALFTGREYYNGYAFLTVHPESANSKVDFRSYFPKRQRFDIGIDQAENGTFYSSQEAEARWRVSQAGDVSLADWKRDELLPFLAEEFNVSLSDAPLEQVFVEPEFELDRIPNRQTATKLIEDTRVLEFSELIGSAENYVITAQSESGKSSLLKQWAARVARAEEGTNRFVPILINFTEVPGYKARTLSLIRSKIPRLPNSITVEALIDQGDLLFLIDDVDFQSSKAKGNLEALLTLCPKCRFVMTTGTQLLASPAVEPLLAEAVPLTRISLRPIRTGQIRSLIEKLGVTDPLQADQILNKMYRESVTLAVPLTPVTGTFLIQIYASKEGDGLINRASLIERFIEIQLDKFAMGDLIPGAFDFRNKSHLLSFIAERMVKEDKYDVPVAEILFWIGEYLDHHGFTYSATKLLRYFVSARILQEECDFVRFRLKAFAEFFVASRMQASQEFREYILDHDRYLSFINEIAFYSAITRDDGKILEEIHTRFMDTFDLCTVDGEPIRVKADALDKLKMPKSKASLAELAEIESQIVSRNLTQDERDIILDHEMMRFTGDDQKVRRTVLETEDGRSVALLVLLSAMLKNTDLIDNARKRQFLKDVISAWSAFAAMSLSLVPSLAKHKKFYFEGVQYRLNFPSDLPDDEIARRLLFIMPVAVARIAFYNVGTEKLRRQLEEEIGSGEALASQFIRFCLLADLGLPGIGRAAQKTASALRSSRYLSNVLVRKLHELLLRFRLPEDEVTTVREITAELMVGLTGQRGRVAGDKKGDLINALRQRELAIKITQADPAE